MLATEVVDGIYTSLTMLGGYFIQAIQQGQDLLRFNPLTSHFLRHTAALIQLRHQPLGQWLPSCGPGGERKDNGDGLALIAIRTVQEILREFQKECGLSCSGSAEDE